MSETLNNIDAVVLCGGLGTRLQSVLGATPKVMAEIEDRPFLDILVHHLKDQGFARVVLCTGHQAELVESYFINNPCGIDVAFSREEALLGTGGAIKNAKDLIRSDTFIVMNGDSLCKVDLFEFVAFHNDKKAMASIVVSQVKDASDFGGIDLNDDKSISAFREKDEGVAGGFVNAGVYCFDQKVFSVMPEKDKFSMEYDLFPSLVGKGIYGHCVENDFLDIGTPFRLEKAKKEIDNLE